MTKKITQEEWDKEWDRYLYGSGSTLLVLEKISKTLGISIPDLKERMATPTEREIKARMLKLT